MSLLLIIILVIVLLAAAGGLLIAAFHTSKKHHQAAQKTAGDVKVDIETESNRDVERIFNDEFREELRNRGRLHFEKIIGENAMFLQQDLRLTTSQLNDYMKAEIKRVLEEEFSKYEESISSAKDLAIQAIEKTHTAIEQQREMMQGQLLEEISAEKERVINKFEGEMADIINHYILTAIGNEIDLTEQLDYIFQYLEDNKAAIIEDIKHGT